MNPMSRSMLSVRREVRPLRLALALLLGLSSGAAWGQNLLPNPGFDSDLDGWFRGAFVPDWSPMDANGLSDSGSARYLHGTDAGGAFLTVCLPVAATAVYTVRADLRFMPAGNTSGAAVSVRSFSGETCTGSQLAVAQPFRLLGEDSDGLWTSLEGTFVAPADATRVQFEVGVGGADDGALEVFVDNVEFCIEGTCEEDGGDLSPCLEGPTTACLLDERFEVTVDWRDFQDGSGMGQVMQFEGARASSDESVFFWFFSPTNFEMGVKMVDACGPFQQAWAFVSGLTNVSYQVRIRDTETGAERVYTNPLGSFPQTVGDTGAFSCGN